MRRRAAVPSLLGLVLGLLLTACTPGSPPGGSPAPDETPAAEPTPLESYDTDVAVTRGPFCDRVSPTGIERALGGTARSHRDYGNGDRIRLADGSRTIAHEFGCSWTGEAGAVARAWVFVPPVTRARARVLVDAAPAGRCSRTGSGGFGDAWLVCSLTAPDTAAVTERRTGEWCVSVLEAART